MALRIRLQRRGKTHNPFYRLVVTSQERGVNADYIESLGHWEPESEDEDALVVDRDRALHWLETGAQPSDTAENLLSDLGILEELEEQRAGA